MTWRSTTRCAGGRPSLRLRHGGGAATRERGLKGVVAKRLGSPYLPGARSGAWVKHKHRRTEPFVVTGWSPAEPRRPESLLLARVGSDGSIEPAGSTPLVLADGQADEVRRQLESLVLPPTRRGQRIRRLAPALRADVALWPSVMRGWSSSAGSNCFRFWISTWEATGAAPWTG